MGPEGIIESKISEFFVIILVEETSSGSDHIDTKPRIESDFSLIEGPYSNSYFHTHF